MGAAFFTPSSSSSPSSSTLLSNTSAAAATGRKAAAVNEDVRKYLATRHLANYGHMFPWYLIRKAYDIAGWYEGLPDYTSVLASEPITLAPGLRVKVYSPSGISHPLSHPGPSVLFFHGGGYCIGSFSSHDPTCRLLAHRLQCPVTAVEYNLAPEQNVWQPRAAVTHCLMAYVWLAAQLSPSAARKVIITGDSAGGQLSIAVALAVRDHNRAQHNGGDSSSTGSSNSAAAASVPSDAHPPSPKAAKRKRSDAGLGSDAFSSSSSSSSGSSETSGATTTIPTPTSLILPPSSSEVPAHFSLPPSPLNIIARYGYDPLMLGSRPLPEPLVIAPIYPCTDMTTSCASWSLYDWGYVLTRGLASSFGSAYHDASTELRSSLDLGGLTPEQYEVERKRHPILSPLFANLATGFPRNLLATAEVDILHDEGVEFHRKLLAAGCASEHMEAKGAIHGFVNNFKSMPSAHIFMVSFTDRLAAIVKEEESKL